jgi:hypothetical protein
VAERLHTDAGYRSFAKEHPSDPRATTAKQYGARLAWRHAENAGTADAYQEFQQDYPDDPRASEAGKLAQGEEISLTDAMQRGWVSSHIVGDDLQNVSLTVERRVHRPLRVSIPAGTYFVSGGDAQNMVACEDNTADLTSSTSAAISVGAACANFNLEQPDSSNTFSVRASHPDPKLRKLLAVIARENPGSRETQLAIWSITDDPSRDDVAAHISPNPDTDDYQQAAHLLREAGINPHSRQMFQGL